MKSPTQHTGVELVVYQRTCAARTNVSGCCKALGTQIKLASAKLKLQLITSSQVIVWAGWMHEGCLVGLFDEDGGMLDVTYAQNRLKAILRNNFGRGSMDAGRLWTPVEIPARANPVALPVVDVSFGELLAHPTDYQITLGLQVVGLAAELNGNGADELTPAGCNLVYQGQRSFHVVRHYNSGRTWLPARPLLLQMAHLPGYLPVLQQREARREARREPPNGSCLREPEMHLRVPQGVPDQRRGSAKCLPGGRLADAGVGEASSAEQVLDKSCGTVDVGRGHLLMATVVRDKPRQSHLAIVLKAVAPMLLAFLDDFGSWIRNDRLRRGVDVISHSKEQSLGHAREEDASNSAVLHTKSPSSLAFSIPSVHPELSKSTHDPSPGGPARHSPSLHPPKQSHPTSRLNPKPPTWKTLAAGASPRTIESSPL
ncbi:hypothetical protein G7046_g4157 [Stylonectria norvegica]|nr:hypothetical protein G7046_g4157 [Stylonectria norvegica]